MPYMPEITERIAEQMEVITEGIYLVDKPSGSSSHDIVNYFRAKSGIKRVGHTGTLDPLASGLLIILVGRAYTKQQSLYLKKDKEYLVEAALGIETDSYDQTGQIVKKANWQTLEPINQVTVQKNLAQFEGKKKQTVPIFSAVKIKGQKLYHKARKGELVDLPSRLVDIKKITLKKFKKDVKKQTIRIEFLVACSSGTYIRSLVHDLGEKMGCGAVLIALRRTKIGQFHVKKAMKLPIHEIKKNYN